MKYLIVLIFFVFALVDLPYYDQIIRGSKVVSLSAIDALPVTIESQKKKIEILEMLAEIDKAKIKNLSDSLQTTQSVIDELETRLTNCQIWHQ